MQGLAAMRSRLHCRRVLKSGANLPVRTLRFGSSLLDSAPSGYAPRALFSARTFLLLEWVNDDRRQFRRVHRCWWIHATGFPGTVGAMLHPFAGDPPPVVDAGVSGYAIKSLLLSLRLLRSYLNFLSGHFCQSRPRSASLRRQCALASSMALLRKSGRGFRSGGSQRLQLARDLLRSGWRSRSRPAGPFHLKFGVSRISDTVVYVIVLDRDHAAVRVLRVCAGHCFSPL